MNEERDSSLELDDGGNQHQT